MGKYDPLWMIFIAVCLSCGVILPELWERLLFLVFAFFFWRIAKIA